MAVAEKEIPTLGGMHIAPLSERSDNLNFLIFGDTGVGKTLFAGSASLVEAMSPVLFIDVEGGTKTLAGAGFESIDLLHIKDEIDPKTGKLVRSAWDALRAVYEELRKGVPYKTIVIDSLTETYAVALKHQLTVANAREGREDPEIAQLRDYFKVGVQIKTFVRAMRDLNCHVVFTCLDQEVKDDRTGTMKVRPNLPGKLVGEIPAFLDEVFYLKVEQVREKQPDGKEKRITKRFMLTQPDGKHLAKDRSGKLPLFLENPDMQTIANFILD